jgi:hypothetical protein
VLRPEQRENGQLEVVRPAAEQVLDAFELTVGEAELTVERLSDLRQGLESIGLIGRESRRSWAGTLPR